MNYGNGVPCTIRSFNGASLPEIEDNDPLESERIRDGFKNKVRETSEILKKQTAALEGILSKTSINKKDREEIRAMFEKTSNFFWNHSTFAIDMFAEATEKMTAQAKKEVDAFYNTAITNIGIKALSELTEEGKHKLLSANKED